MATIETKETITVDMLTEESVSILKKTMATIDGKDVQVGENWRRAYVNSTEGRKQLETEVADPYKTSILAVWGDTPKVADVPTAHVIG